MKQLFGMFPTFEKMDIDIDTSEPLSMCPSSHSIQAIKLPELSPYRFRSNDRLKKIDGVGGYL